MDIYQQGRRGSVSSVSPIDHPRKALCYTSPALEGPILGPGPELFQSESGKHDCVSSQPAGGQEGPIHSKIKEVVVLCRCLRDLLS